MKPISEDKERIAEAFSKWLKAIPKPNEYNRMYGHHLTSWTAGAEYERTIANKQLEEKDKLYEKSIQAIKQRNKIIEEKDKTLDKVKELLAILHRDGGHHIEKVDLDQSILDAINKIHVE